MEFVHHPHAVALIRTSRRAFLAPLASLLLAAPVHAEYADVRDMADLSIEELASIQITSVSKKPEPLGSAAASVFVITADDLRRSGAHSVPEALRLAPNLHVAQSNMAGYAITARGLNGSNNSAPNKLLVLIDGRSVYSPFFSGVFWDAQDLMLDDVERIEVVSGPGGTLWGVNAVNGVINIITRTAASTAGSLTTLEAGTRGAEVAFRQGGATAHGGWRVYGKHLERSHTEMASGARVNDARHQSQVGFRADWNLDADRFTVNGNAYQGAAQQPEPGLISVTGTSLKLGTVATSGVNLTGSWMHRLADGGSLSLQAYLDHTKRTVPPTFAELLNIADVQFQHSLRPMGQHRIAWGANYRHSWDNVTNSGTIAFLPPEVEQDWASLFARDEIGLRDDLRLTIGARIERNDYTGNEFLPTMRLSWQAAPAHSFWAAASRTVRAPSRLDADAYIPGRPPYLLRGGLRVRSEVAKVFELGYRGQPLPGLSYSATLFHNDYDHLRTQEIDPGYTYITFDSLMEGKANGIEMWGSYQATPAWRLSAGLTALHQSMQLKPGSNDLAGPGTAGKDPSHTVQLRSTHILARGKELEVAVRKVAALENPAVPGYTAVDARFGWQVNPEFEVSVTAQNINGDHAEYGPIATRSEIPRSVAVRLVWGI
ncbi:TonB-dependent receptor [Massilia sp. RP-1-19]|uniref:TonB-dependent receptor n=1 Tax=Massilia polaris TaxID=2728846 RepID=A0A848HNM5_9BURK|nr:TonB-dependent receptor [Massilia polaris]NML61411.1 TonB-dependent receptor [Massilia polaris]